MSLRCKIGLHKWIPLGTNMLLTDQVYQCSRCRVGKHVVQFGAGHFMYSAEAMKQAWLDGKIDNTMARARIYGDELEARLNLVKP